ncbi:c-type cytochrome [Pusillimonas sp. TS35]|uniref:c-type cytochrome n=1 Tax=Paracandidimonas lactea TaxID=2895524 RepID=UPI00136888C7|nr:c-type cytochrome [Paracandidimonas lactea]MYN14468.1 c-type cytochrome [Pusillimonas sp. TS35]
MKSLTIALAGAALFAMGGAAAAADLAAGKATYEKTCAACHGADGKTPIMATYPILAGQHRDYLEHALKAYQRGAKGAPASANIRKNAIMAPMAASLSPTDIQNVAAWLASQPSPLAVEK